MLFLTVEVYFHEDLHQGSIAARDKLADSSLALLITAVVYLFTFNQVL